MTSAALQLRFDDFELDEADARLKRSGTAVALPPKAFGVLCALARQPGVLVTKNALLDAVWGHQHVSESVLKTTISQVRAALADDATSPRFIETASRLGYRFIAPIARDERQVAPPPAAKDGAGTDSFIGRSGALQRLSECWRRAGAAQRQLVWVAGDAGVGKSTLLEHFTRGSGASAICQGQCVEQYGSGEPYLPILQALGDLCRAYPELMGTMRTVAPTWLLQLPWLVPEAERAALARELAGVSQERMVREFHELMVRFTQTQPLLFIVEDLHWCDQATLRLMDHFARQRTPVRMLWIGSFRLSQVIAEGHPLQQLRQELRLHRLCEEILLDPFSEAEVQEYLRSRAPASEAPESFIRRVHAHTDGLPLFVATVIDTLLAAEPDATRERQSLKLASAKPLPVPEDLAGAVEARIAKLGADVVAVLETAAVCGVEFRAGAVAEALGLSHDAVIDACDQLVRQQYWLRHVATIDLNNGALDSLYAFRHAIYRHVFYQRQAEAARVHRHRRVARALATGADQGVPLVAAEHALHYERGREIAPALCAYALAAQGALRSFAPQAAIELCEHALTLLRLLPEGAERLALELGIQSPLGTAVGQLHGIGSAASRGTVERVAELCELLPQHPARALLLNGYGASLFSRGEYVKLQEMAERLDQLQGPDRQALSVMTAMFRAGATAARGECRVATQWWQKAIADCESITDRSGFMPFVVDPETAVRANSVRTFYERGLIDRARAESLKAVTLSHKVGQPLGITLANWRAGMLEVRLGNPQKVIEHADVIRDVVAKTTVSQGDGPSHYLRGWAMAQLGDPRQGVELIRDGLARHLKVGMISTSTEVMGYAAEALILAGDWQAANTQLAEAFAQARELDEQYYVPILLLLQARVARGLGDTAAAHQWLQEAVRMARSQEAPGFELKAACAVAEHPAATADDRQALAKLLDSFTEGRDTGDYRRGRALLT